MKNASTRPRLFLSPPHMGGAEKERVREAFESNYIAPLGPHVNAFEAEFAAMCGIPHCAALSSGTAAMHLALEILGIGPGDVVLASTLTFIGSVTPVRFLGAEPVFIDADPATWNMNPELLARALDTLKREGVRPKAVVPTDLYGQCADYDRIREICDAEGIPLVVDAAEAVGATYKGRHAGAGSRAAVYSFNGNKIITTSGGGMLASEDGELIQRARWLSQQAREPLPHYEHKVIGYNYRMSNVCAAIGRGQLEVLAERAARKREIFETYVQGLSGIPGVEFMPEAAYGESNRWLSVILLDPEEFGADPETVRLALEAENVESRPVWKPMHMQPVFAGCRAFGGETAEDLFARGLCLPSGTAMTRADLELVIGLVRDCGKQHMWHNFKNYRFYLMLVADLAAFAVSLYAAYLIRFDFSLSDYYSRQFFDVLKYALSIKVAVFFGLGLYKGMWRYTSLSDFWKILEGAVLQSLILVAIVLFKFGFFGFSRGVFIIDGILTFLFTGGIRVVIRSAYSLSSSLENSPVRTTDVLVIGAGRSGERIAREIQNTPRLPYNVVGFVDDDRSKRGRTLHGKPVLGVLADLPKVLAKNAVDELFIAITEATAEQMRAIVEACKATGKPHKILPSMGEIIHGKDAVRSMREVNYRDLLGRAPVELDTAAISRDLSGKTILISGCGGSIGSELVRQIVRFKPGKLVLVEASEFNLYQIQMELMHEVGFHDYVVVLGAIQDVPLMEAAFAEHRPDAVFHAAAYKHVPMLEYNPWQAVKNNILGTRAIMDASVRHGVKRFVVVSTDKAVRPTNVMGASKRITELMMDLYQGQGTTFMAVRFGNVLGSSGSVVPLFKRQIERGGPVTVTHPDVTRYFMSIAEAVQLILQAGTMARGGEIFVLEMGEPVKIADMARDLIRLSGKTPDVDVEIKFTGLRPGEKLYEELITSGEDVVRTEHDKIMVLGRSADTGSSERVSGLTEAIERLTAAADRYDAEAVRAIMREIVPEFHPAKN